MSAPSAPASVPGVPGVRPLLALRIAEIGAYVLQTLPVFLPFELARRLELPESASGALSLLLGLLGFALLVPFALGRRRTPAHGAVRVAVVLAALGLCFDLLWSLELLGGVDLLRSHAAIETAVGVVSYAVAVGLQLAFWRALVLSGGGRPGWSVAFHALVAVGVSTWLLRTLLPFAVYRDLFLGTALGTALSAVRFVVAVARQLLPILVLRELAAGRTGPSATDGSHAPHAPAEARSRDLLVGALWLGGGLAVTVISYSAASGGGRFVVTTGAIVYGAFRVLRGLTSPHA